jgi:hydrogenase maturation protein HypF
MELEMIAEEMPSRLYEWHWDKNGKEEEGSEETRYRISTVPLIKGIVQDLTEGVAPSEISARFHGTIIRMIAELTAVLGRETALNQVAFSGGVFQNAILLSGLSQALTHSGFEVFSHSEIPTNDGGIALGQALVAAAKMESTP